jgi:hypothetical protein
LAPGTVEGFTLLCNVVKAFAMVGAASIEDAVKRAVATAAPFIGIVDLHRRRNLEAASES